MVSGIAKFHSIFMIFINCSRSSFWLTAQPTTRTTDEQPLVNKTPTDWPGKEVSSFAGPINRPIYILRRGLFKNMITRCCCCYLHLFHGGNTMRRKEEAAAAAGERKEGRRQFRWLLFWTSFKLCVVPYLECPPVDDDGGLSTNGTALSVGGGAAWYLAS